MKSNLHDSLYTYHGDQNEWLTDSPLGFAHSFSEATEAWLNYLMLYGLEEWRDYAQRVLMKPTYSSCEEFGELKPEQYSVVVRYFDSITVLNLALRGSIVHEPITQASRADEVKLKKFGYKSYEDIIGKVEQSVFLEQLVPRLARNLLLGENPSGITKKVSISRDAPHDIWVDAWNFLTNAADDAVSHEGQLSACWSSLVSSWKRCFAESNYSGFRRIYLIDCYYILCRQSSEHFDLGNVHQYFSE
ncbi:MAG: hypothetical protein R3286_01830 [Gammaproteobacteria bacterium]|nr:hypothetical protein [Gammaproteobacteria bacterium]